MTISSEWTTEERSIVRALALQVSIMTLDQIARGWFRGKDDAQRQAADSLDKLATAGLIELRRVEAPPIVKLSNPLHSWSPGSPAPSHNRLASIAERASQRRNVDAVPTQTYVATAAAACLFGAFRHAGPPKECELHHDLQLAEVFVRYLRSRRRQARQWLGEAAFPKLGFDIKGMKDPDAFIVLDDGRTRHIVEYVGNYSVDHLAAFHTHCSGQAAQRLAAFTIAAPHSMLSRLYNPQGTGYQLW